MCHCLYQPNHYILIISGIRIRNPLTGVPRDALLQQVEALAREKGLNDILPILKQGALLAQDRAAFEGSESLDSSARTALTEEITHKWRHPRALYITIALCSIGAAVQ